MVIHCQCGSYTENELTDASIVEKQCSFSLIRCGWCCCCRCCCCSHTLTVICLMWKMNWANIIIQAFFFCYFCTRYFCWNILSALHWLKMMYVCSVFAHFICSRKMLRCTRTIFFSRFLCFFFCFSPLFCVLSSGHGDSNKQMHSTVLYLKTFDASEREWVWKN